MRDDIHKAQLECSAKLQICFRHAWQLLSNQQLPGMSGTNLQLLIRQFVILQMLLATTTASQACPHQYALQCIKLLMCVCSALKTLSKPPFKASAKTSPHPCKIASRQPSRHPLPPLGATMHPIGQNTQSLVCWLTSLVPSQGLLVPTAVATDSGSGLGMAG